MDKLTKKQEIFDIFYGKKPKARKGGGTIKNKMTRLNPSFEEINNLEKNIKNTILLKYFNKIKNRDVNLAPPPRP